MRFSIRITVLSVFLFCASGAFGFELEAADVISRHLDSIATSEKRESLKTLFAIGSSEFESKVPVAKGGGKVVVVSDIDNLYFLMSLNSRDYPFEKIGAFSGEISLPYISPGQRSLLGAFLADNSRILLDSLFCGTMSRRWMARIGEPGRLKMRMAKKKKINGKEAYVLDIFPSGSDTSKFSVRLFFDSENFRHIRSEYHREVEIGLITFGKQNQLQNASADLVEEFSDFREADGFTLPFLYKATLTSNTPTQAYQASWGIRVAGYNLNQKLAPGFFTFDVK